MGLKWHLVKADWIPQFVADEGFPGPAQFALGTADGSGFVGLEQIPESARAAGGPFVPVSLSEARSSVFSLICDAGLRKARRNQGRGLDFPSRPRRRHRWPRRLEARWQEPLPGPQFRS